MRRKGRGLLVCTMEDLSRSAFGTRPYAHKSFAESRRPNVRTGMLSAQVSMRVPRECDQHACSQSDDTDKPRELPLHGRRLPMGNGGNWLVITTHEPSDESNWFNEPLGNNRASTGNRQVGERKKLSSSCE